MNHRVQFIGAAADRRGRLLCSILDGCSRYTVNWDLWESMTEADIEVILERAKELHPEAKPRIISHNRSQFIAKDFQESIRISGMTHVSKIALLSPIERKNRTLAQIAQRRVHPAKERHCRWKMRGAWLTATSSATTTFASRCDRLHHAEGHARRMPPGDPG